MRVTLWLFGLGFLSACQNYSENSLGTDLNSMVKCPANGCANHPANENEMTISFFGSQPILSSASDSTVQIGGNCYPSTFPNNQILVSVTNSASAAVSVPVYPLNSGTLSCVSGRYNFSLHGGGLPGPNVYRVRMEVVGLTSQNVQKRSPGAVLDVSLTRY